MRLADYTAEYRVVQKLEHALLDGKVIFECGCIGNAVCTMPYTYWARPGLTLIRCAEHPAAGTSPAGAPWDVHHVWRSSGFGGISCDDFETIFDELMREKARNHLPDVSVVLGYIAVKEGKKQTELMLVSAGGGLGICRDGSIISLAAGRKIWLGYDR